MIPHNYDIPDVSDIHYYYILVFDLPNIVNDLPAPVIPYASAVEFIPFNTFYINGIIAYLNIYIFVVPSSYTPFNLNMCYFVLPSLKLIVLLSTIYTDFLDAP